MKPMGGVSRRKANKLLADLPGVQRALERNARNIERRARALFYPHVKTGQHAFNITKGKVDRIVNFVGPGAVAINEGHINQLTGGYVEGLKVLQNAVRDMGGAR